jgi:hypothetical protein
VTVRLGVELPVRGSSQRPLQRLLSCALVPSRCLLVEAGDVTIMILVTYLYRYANDEGTI